VEISRGRERECGVHREPTLLQRAIEETLRDLRVGDVVSYGFVAEQAGYPGRARAVGAYLASTDDAPNWWRVVAASGRLRAPRPELQAQLLAAEGVDVVDGRVSRRPSR
jgi:methylated-DNA-protein-cysteine methyltransferase-like protein